MTPLLEGLAAAFENVTWGESHGQDVAHVPPDEWLAFAQAAQRAGFTLLADITAVDWMRDRADRFEVVANLVAMDPPSRLRLVTTAGRNEPTVASLTPLWPGASFPEREVFDMFGIHFDGHPDLTRILMPDDWEGHPLRKDFGVGSVPVQFKESHKAT